MPEILVLTQTHNLWGGIEAWMADLFPELEQRGWTVRWALARGRRHNDPEAFARHHPWIRDYDVLDGRPGTSGARQRSIERVLAHREPDAVIPIAIGDAFPAVLRRRRAGSRTRLLCAIHSQHAGTLADIANHREHVDMVVAVGGLTHRWALSLFGAQAQRVRLVRNGVASPIQQPSFDRSRRRLRLGYIGRLAHVQKRACDVHAIVADERMQAHVESLVVAGDGPARGEMEAGLSIARVPFRMLGALARDRLYSEVYPAIDCLLLTSMEEAGGPLVVIEAMQHGAVPVVSDFQGRASDGLLLPEINCLVFPVGDTAAAAGQIARLAADPALRERLSRAARERLSRAARERVRHEYSVGAMLNGWTRAFDDLLELPALPRPVPEDPRLEVHGRLDRWGIPPRLADWLRTFRRSRTAVDGFEEWPGSLAGSTDAILSVDNQLAALDREARMAPERHSRS